MYYEVLWYNCTKEEKENGLFDDYDNISFRTKKQAIKYYEQHKDDEDKAGWWVTKRDNEGFVIEDIIL